MTEAVLAAPRTRAVATTEHRLQRIAGVGGLIFAAVVAAENLIVGSMSPPRGDATAAEITDFFAANKTGLAIAVGMVPFAVVALFLFIGGAYPRLSRGTAEGGMWARVGAIGVVLVGALFLTGIVFETALIADADRLADQGGLTETLWRLRQAAQVVTGLVLAVTLLGLSRAARLSGLIPAWHETLGLAAAGAFFVAAVAILPAIEGSPIGLLGFAAFVVWLVWLALTSVRLLRAGSEAG